MEKFDPKELKKLYRPEKNSHKGENGKLLVIGGSNLFHGASLWSLEVASRIVDMVFYSSVPVNEAIVQKQKERFHDGIIVPQGKLTEYLEESDCVLVGPGMERARHSPGKDDQGIKVSTAFAVQQWIEEGNTEAVVNYLLKKYPDKKWVVDGGALQVVNPAELLNSNMIATPHNKEFEILKSKFSIFKTQFSINDQLIKFSKECKNVTIVLKGKEDLICQGDKLIINQTGNEGMTKGGTGDVLAGLVAALYCKNEAFLAASCGAYLNGLAGDKLYERVGRYFNASDLVKEIPRVMKETLI